MPSSPRYDGAPNKDSRRLLGWGGATALVLGAAAVASHRYGSGRGVQLTSEPVDQAFEGPVPFYLYGKAFSLRLTKPCNERVEEAQEPAVVSYMEVNPFFIQQLEKHPWRVRDPEQASLYVIPFDLERSLAHYKCSGGRHMRRVHNLMDALEASPWFRRSGGTDHFWAALHYGLHVGRNGIGGRHDKIIPTTREHLLRNMTVGRYYSSVVSLEGAARMQSLHLNVPNTLASQFRWLTATQIWRCPVLLPILSPEGLLVRETFEEWNKRPIFAYFRGKERDCYNKRNQQLRNASLALANEMPGSIFSNEHARNAAAYKKEISSAKFCLVFGCDDPQTSRFIDAVAGGCIPVVINDAFRTTVAPFAHTMNYDSFTLTIPESAWLQDPRMAVHIIFGGSEAVLRRLQRGLMAAQAELLWRHPQSNVATRVLRTVGEQCLS